MKIWVDYLQDLVLKLSDCNTKLGLFACEIYYGPWNEYFPSFAKQNAKPRRSLIEVIK